MLMFDSCLMIMLMLLLGYGIYILYFCLFIYFFVNISSKDVINWIFWMPLLTTSSLGTSGGWLFTSTSNQGTSRNWACFGGKVEKEKSSHLWPVAYDFQGYFIWGIIFLFYTMQLLTPNVVTLNEFWCD